MPFKEELATAISVLTTDHARQQSKLSSLCLTPCSTFGEACDRFHRILADLDEYLALVKNQLATLQQIQRNELITSRQLELLTSSRCDAVMKLCEDYREELKGFVGIAAPRFYFGR